MKKTRLLALAATLALGARAFRGRDPEVQPLLEERGLAPARP